MLSSAGTHLQVDCLHIWVVSWQLGQASNNLMPIVLVYQTYSNTTGRQVVQQVESTAGLGAMAW
jgi:hypothetical protein